MIKQEGRMGQPCGMEPRGSKPVVSGRRLARGALGIVLGLTCLAGLPEGRGAAMAQAVRVPLPVPVVAAVPMTPLVVQNDGGGSVRKRMAEIAELERSGRPVEIRGECVSSCTMFLSLSKLCIDQGARFAFHGASRYGVPLKKDEFDRWSARIASYYPAPLAEWYMRTGRYAGVSFKVLPAREIMKLGVKACPDREG